MQSHTVIQILKGHFGRYGIPEVVVSDRGPQFTSGEFQDFSKMWSFQHVKSSPYHHQSNGKAENAVKIIKNILIKAKEDKTDATMALLEWRNTPTEDFNSSPVQRFLGRRTRTTLPLLAEKLLPEPVSRVPDIQEKKLKKQAKYYNQSSKDLPLLNPGTVVYVQPVMGEAKWKIGKVVKEISPRSYIVQTDGRQYIRNRKFLRKATSNKINVDENMWDWKEDEDTSDDNDEAQHPEETEEEGSHDEENNHQESKEAKTSRGRVIRRPVRFQDYV